MNSPAATLAYLQQVAVEREATLAATLAATLKRPVQLPPGFAERYVPQVTAKGKGDECAS